MVQIYNPNVVGKHILIDIKNVDSDKLKLVEDMKLFLNKIVEDLNLNGGKITLDIFTCDVTLEDRNIKKIICDFLGCQFVEY